MGSKAPGVQAHVQVPGPPRSPSPGSEPSYAKPFKSRNLSQSSSANSSLQVERSGPEVINFFPCSTQLSRKFILHIYVKMPTIVGILTFISMINTTSERLKAIKFFICRYFRFYEQLKFRAQLS